MGGVAPPKKKQPETKVPFKELIPSITTGPERFGEKEKPQAERKDKEVKEPTLKERFKAFFGRSWIDRLRARLDIEEYLYEQRIAIHASLVKQLEMAWGKGNVVAVLYHSHTSGADNGYKGSPDGIFSLDEELPRLLEAIRKGIGAHHLAIFITDHEVHEDGQLSLLAEVVERNNQKYPTLTFMTGSEQTSTEGHEITLESENGHVSELKESNVVTPRHSSIEIAEWAFKNGHSLLIPHPNPKLMDPKRFLQQPDIGIEEEYVRKILELSKKYDRIVLIARSNGTTSTNYEEWLLGSRKHFWEIWKTKPISKEAAMLYNERAMFIDESDGHIKCEYPTGIVYFRKDEVMRGGKVSPKLITGMIQAEKKRELEWRKRSQKVTLEEMHVVSFNPDTELGTWGRLAKGVYLLEDRFRLVGAWLKHLVTLRKPRKYLEKPKRRYEAQCAKLGRCEMQAEQATKAPVVKEPEET